MGINIVYHIGVVCGIILLYLLVTIGFGFLIECMNGNEDALFALIFAYTVGLIIFIAVMSDYLKVKDLWNVQSIPTSSSIVKEADE